MPRSNVVKWITENHAVSLGLSCEENKLYKPRLTEMMTRITNYIKYFMCLMWLLIYAPAAAVGF